MIYLEPKHRVMKYLAKPKTSGMLMLAHLKCLKSGSNDFKTLTEIKIQREAKQNVSELTPYTDAKFDIVKVRNLFIKRVLLTAEEFNTAVTELENEDYIHPERFEATQKSVDLYIKMRDEKKLEVDKRRNLDNGILI